MKQIICFFRGHNIINGLYENDEFLYVQICATCGKPHGKFIYKPFRDILPPETKKLTHEENLKSWNAYFDSKLEFARKNLIIQ